MHDNVLISRQPENSPAWITVEVVFANPAEQTLVALKLAEGSTIEEAINASGLLNRFPEIDLSINKIGIFGSVCSLDRTLKQNDRVEIYRPLLNDPKETRRIRAAKKSVSRHRTIAID
jgi:putative ubiquitin-RnfH superfamily antitoxin RatB of RatAB toxin-antitoxin module